MNPTRREQCVAVIAALLIQWMLFKLLNSPGPVATPGEETEPLRIRFIAREPPPQPQTTDPNASEAPVSHPLRAGLSSMRLEAPAAVRTSGDTHATSRTTEPLNLTLATSAAPDFSRRPLEGDTRLDRFAAPPERIPMRKPLTGKDVIEGAAQILGFWPPGYTTDPCPRIRRNIDELKTDGSAAGRERLEQEMARQARYCP
jgi:hypothetical protein